MNILEADIDICARTVYGEARGESFEGKKAVAWVMRNRWLSTEGQFEKDDTLATACLRHRQFSAWNKEDPNFKAMFTVQANNIAFRECVRAVRDVLDQPSGADPTQGSTHYHTTSAEPGWSIGVTPVLEAGVHVFFNNIP